MDLHEGALRAQLTRGTPPERVLAAWELALRLGGEAVAELRDRLDHETSVGARRHLVVVLAGLGEREAVRAVAEHDLDERVRATAIRYAARVCGDVAERDAYLAERLARDGASDVVLAVLEVASTSTEPLASAFARLLAHPSLEVRATVTARYEATGAPIDVVERAVTEPDDELRARIAWLASRRDPSTLTRLAEDTMRVVLERMLSEGERASWADLASWATKAIPAPDDAALVLDVLDEPFDAVPLGPLLRLLSQSYFHGSREHVLDRVLDRCEGTALGDADRAALVTLAEPFRPSSLRDEVRQGLRTVASKRLARIRRLVGR